MVEVASRACSSPRPSESMFASWVSTAGGQSSDVTTEPSYSNRWYCEVCSCSALPITGSRHHCRTCRRTVCDGCSDVATRGERTCTDCSIHAAKCEQQLPREKYVFLVRHAQSDWNKNIDMIKTVRGAFDFNTQEISLKDIMEGAANLMAKEVWTKDHPISEQGLRQTEELRHKITAMRQNGSSTTCSDGPESETQSAGHTASHSSRDNASPRLEPSSEREQRYYDSFLSHRQQIYCSPLLRALQTAHLALPAQDGWGLIKLLKDARECFSLRLMRDCVGARGAVGTHIIDRAMRMGQELPGLQHRVDHSDCVEKWWSDEPETEVEIEARLKTLWRTLLEEDGDDSCVLVTHSNLIKALLMHVGGVDDGCEQDAPGDLGTPERDSWCEGDLDESENGTSSWQVVARSSGVLRSVKVERLQNCGVLGLRCVLEPPPPRLRPEVDGGWIDLDDSPATNASLESHWVARDALLMFDSVLVK